ncbi:MAG TPA: hypothetical protein VFY24_11875 [Azospira sp.]|nr:hypothetical protein [Azospira sp.]
MKLTTLATCVTVLVVVLVVALRIGFSAGMSYAGYCFAEQKTLSDNEKIRALVDNVLKKSPPAVALKEIRPGVPSYTVPSDPIRYEDVDEFLALNPGCCELTETRDPEEGGPYFMERLTGTVSGYARIDYLVRYREDGVVKSVPSKNHLPVSNCGKPTRKWYPGDYFFGFHPSNFAD